MPKSLQLLIELIQEDKLDITEVLEGLGYEIVKRDETEAWANVYSGDGNYDCESIGYDEVITIKKEIR